MDELHFKIGAFSPDTIPMARLAEYLATLAELLGNEKGVHFVRLDPGSVELVHRVDQEDQPKVSNRLAAIRLGDGPVDVIKAYRKLDNMLANDDAVGELTTEDRLAVIVEFPGKNRPKAADYGAFNQIGSFDGIPIKVGGREEFVPVHLQEMDPVARVHTCSANRSLAKAIAGYLFETPIRVHGTGRWRRESSGQWALLKFTISDFEVLDNASLEAVVASLRDVPGKAWQNLSDPLAALAALRSGEDCLH